MTTANPAKSAKKRKDDKKKTTVKTELRVKKRAINASLKTITVAAEPPIDHDPTHLNTTFRASWMLLWRSCRPRHPVPVC